MRIQAIPVIIIIFLKICLSVAMANDTKTPNYPNDFMFSMSNSNPKEKTFDSYMWQKKGTTIKESLVFKRNGRVFRKEVIQEWAGFEIINTLNQLDYLSISDKIHQNIKTDKTIQTTKFFMKYKQNNKMVVKNMVIHDIDKLIENPDNVGAIMLKLLQSVCSSLQYELFMKKKRKTG